MADKTELTSAFADGEVNDKEVNDALSAIYQNDELKERWQRYHLIGDALRKNLPPTIHSDLSQRVAQAIENEPTILSPSTPSVSSKPEQVKVKKQKVGFAIAASVAMVGMVSFFVMDQQTKQMPTPQVAQQTQAINPAPVVASTPATTPSVATRPHVVLASDGSQAMVVDRLEPQSPKLKSYVLEHEYSTSSTVRRGLPPAVRVVTFSNER